MDFLHRKTISNLGHKFSREIADLIFPPICPICRSYDPGYLCPDCKGKIKIFDDIFCAACEKRIPTGAIMCCRPPKTHIRSLGILGPYENGVLKELIHSFKYGNGKVLAKSLADLLSRYALKTFFPLAGIDPGTAIFVPMPLHPKRERQRGYNQAELLALELSKITHVPVRKLLVRKIYKKPQAEIGNALERKKNMDGVFAASSEIKNHLSPPKADPPMAEKTIILVDDVTTTGATLEEAAKTLWNAGAKNIYALVLAK